MVPEKGPVHFMCAQLICVGLTKALKTERVEIRRASSLQDTP